MKLALSIILVALTGCASRHAYMSKPEGLASPRLQCDSFHPNDCEMVQDWNPSQLTPVGCVLHTVVTGGHVAWECRKPKNGKTPDGGRWIWAKSEGGR